MKVLMKSGFLTFVLALAILSVSVAQNRGSDVRESPNAAVSQSIGQTVVELTYGRPAIKNRSYYSTGSALAPLGEPWRTGANEATAITFSADALVAGKPVKAGTYSLYTIPGDKEWGVAISTNLAWGIPIDTSKDVFRSATTSIDRSAPFAEWFNISFDNLSAKKADLVLHWGNTRVSIPIEVK